MNDNEYTITGPSGRALRVREGLHPMAKRSRVFKDVRVLYFYDAETGEKVGMTARDPKLRELLETLI